MIVSNACICKIQAVNTSIQIFCIFMFILWLMPLYNQNPTVGLRHLTPF